nr:MAG: polyprotein [Yellow silver pine badnavirus]
MKDFRPGITRAQTVEEKDKTPTVEDRIRSYRLKHRLKHNLAQKFRKTKESLGLRTLEQTLNPDEQLRLSQGKRAALVPAETLYSAGWNDITHKVYQHYTEERILCIGSEQQVQRPFITEDSYDKLVKSGFEHIHIGMIMLRIHGLHRKNAGTMALVVLRDTRWGDDRSVIGTMEVDMSTGTQLLYLSPDLFLSIHDFYNHVEIVIQTKGYESWNAAESNLLITRSLIGRLTNTSFAKFNYRVSNVMDFLASRGIQAIPGSPHSTAALQGGLWNIRPVAKKGSQLPATAEMASKSDGSVSLRFRHYATQPSQPSQKVDSQDIECDPDEEEFAGILTLQTEEDDFDDLSWIPENCTVVGLPTDTDDTDIFYDANDTFEDLQDEMQRLANQPQNHIELWTDATQTLPALVEQCFFLEGVRGLEQLQTLGDFATFAETFSPEVSKQRHEHIHVITEDLGYPALRLFKQRAETALSGISDGTSAYRLPPDTVIGPSNYPPARVTADQQQDTSWSGSYRKVKFKEQSPSSNTWVLPNAQQAQAAMLVLPDNVGLFDDVISRWESITLNHLSSKNWDDNQSKVNYVENLLGEYEKVMWIQWRMKYSAEYQALISAADDPRNITSQVRKICTLEDPYQGSTEQQTRAYQDLERLTCPDAKSLMSYINEYWRLASKTGRAFITEELSSKFFLKMPPLIGRELEAAFFKKYPGVGIGILPRVHFSYQYLSEMCKQAALQRSLKDLSFCSDIPIPGYYTKKKKLGIRKSKTYKGKPHESHLRVFKKKDYKKQAKCKCFICGEEGHFSRDCKQKKGNIVRKAMLDNLDIPDEYDVLSVGHDESESDAICSVSEGEDGPRDEVCFVLLQEANKRYPKPDYLPYKWLSPEKEACHHDWEYNGEIESWSDSLCAFCKTPTNKNMRIYCPKCKTASCPMCSKVYCGEICIIKKQKDKGKSLITESDDSDSLELELLKKNLQLEKKVRAQELEIKLLKELLADSERRNEQCQQFKVSSSRNGDHEKSESSEDSERTEPDSEVAAVLLKEKKVKKKKSRKIKEPEIATVLLEEDPESKEEEEIIQISQNDISEESGYETKFTGINSTQTANKKIKNGQMEIDGNRFRIPLIYCFPMCSLADGIQLLIGCNFIKSMTGGLRIEGNLITFYKNVANITTQPEAEVMALMAESYEEHLQFQQETACNIGEDSPSFLKQNFEMIEDMRTTGYIGNNPMLHWRNNQVLCFLDIINPDLCVQDKPLKQVTPVMADAFRRHVDSLLSLGVVRESRSRHRTMAIIVHSGTTVNPVTGKEERGKERMVFNYRTVNDNTHKDQYSLPGMNTIIQRVGGSRIYSKFDLKSGFHQVAMHEDSIPWTAFVTPGGLYEWLVMPFGLKNAPAVFQRKMDVCFRGTEHFIAVYIDDILVFSKNEKEHAEHLQCMLQICKQNGLILSPTKMKIASPRIEFLGAIIGEGKLKLQPHIMKKILEFDDSLLQEKKGLRSWLGILNYARSYIPKLGILLGPLYSKTSPTGDKRMKPSDWKIVREIKENVAHLPDLEIPPTHCHIVIETDGCMEGWGGVCKWKPSRHDSKGTEKVCAYASGKFPTIKSTIDSEINACMESLSAFKIFYLDKKEMTIRTDCHSIISFFNKSASNKPSRVRWMGFLDFISGTGVQIFFEHIDGKHNALADALSRLANTAINSPSDPVFKLTTELLQVVQEIETDNSLTVQRKEIYFEEIQQWLLKSQVLQQKEEQCNLLLEKERRCPLSSGYQFKPADQINTVCLPDVNGPNQLDQLSNSAFPPWERLQHSEIHGRIPTSGVASSTRKNSSSTDDDLKAIMKKQHSSPRATHKSIIDIMCCFMLKVCLCIPRRLRMQSSDKVSGIRASFG